MTLGKQQRMRFFILFMITLLSIILMAVSFLDQSVQNELNLNFWIFIFIIISICATTYLFIYGRKLSNPKTIENQVNMQVEKARAEIVAEYETKEEEVINKSIDIEERLNKIIPRGKFKTAKGFADKLLAKLSDELQASIGVIFIAKGKKFQFLSGFALSVEETPADFKSGENLNGQVAASKEALIIREIPEEYFYIESGLGKSKPKTMIIAPILHRNTTIGIIEIATFNTDDDDSLLELLQKVGISAGEKLVQIQKA